MFDRQRQLERAHEARIRWRQAFLQDAILYLFLGIIIVIVGWGAWRLDDRSERLFAVVAAERSRVPGCP
jgi:hypothetical protein